MEIGELFKNNALVQLGASRLFVQVTIILQSIIISRLLGPEGKGVFTEIILWPTLIGSLSMLGLYTGIVRISAKKNIRKYYNVCRSVMITTCITGVIGIIVTLIINGYYFYHEKYLIAAQIFSIYVLIYNMNRGLSAINNGRGHMGIFSISASILNPVYFICLLFLLILDKITVETALLALLFANLCSLLFLYFKRERDSNCRLMSPKKMIGYSIKFSPADFSEPLYLYFDKIIIAIILSSYDLGLYTIAYSSAGMINIVSSTISIKLFSDIARGDTKQIFRYVRINLMTMILIAILMCGILPILIPIVFGSEFLPAVFISLLLLPVCILQGESLIIEKSILAKGMPFVGIQAKILTMSIFSLCSFLLYAFNISSLITISLLLIISQCIYLAYLRHRMKYIFGDNRIIPNLDDVKNFSKRVFK